MRILVTGGAGYIGSHACVVFLQAGMQAVVVDNLVNSHEASIHRVREITGCPLDFRRVDLLDETGLDEVFETCGPFDGVVHFAGLKAVGESVSKPLRYYVNNLTGTLNLLEAMQRHRCRTLVFSSSATVYGDPERVPIEEDFPLKATNPYGRTKLMIEDMLRDLYRAQPHWRIAVLRYFNPVGAHESGRIGEDPNGIPSNLMPYIAQVAVGKLPELRVYGDDYPTIDGTGVRDYIHVVDLAEGHLRALEWLTNGEGRSDRDAAGTLLTVNLGTGRGYSVLEMVEAFRRASGREIPYRIVGRRPGDVPSCYADPARAGELLGWSATRGIDDMCADTWRWQSHNPNGYASSQTPNTG